MKPAILTSFLLIFGMSLPVYAETLSQVDAAIDSVLMGAPAGKPTPVSPLAQSQPVKKLVTADQKDNRGVLYEVTGNVRYAKKGSTKWEPAVKDLLLEEGDMILTGKDASASISFDDNYQNVTHIPENTRAIFRSIEPTDVYLEDGTLFNFFDGLEAGSKWKVSTPTAVAAVRGTHFLMNYTAANGQVLSAVFDVPQDGHKSFVSLIDILPSGQEGSSADIGEGFQINLRAGQTPDPSLLEEIDPKWIEKTQKFLESLAVLRANGILPATGGEGSLEDALLNLFNKSGFNFQDQVQDLLRSQDVNGFVLSEPIFTVSKEVTDPDILARREAFQAVYNPENVQEAIQNLREFLIELQHMQESNNVAFVDAVLEHLYNEGVLGTYNHPDVQETFCGEGDCRYFPEEGEGEEEYNYPPNEFIQIQQGSIKLHEDLQEQLAAHEDTNVEDLPLAEQVGGAVFTGSFQVESGDVSIENALEAFEGALSSGEEFPEIPQGPSENV